MHKTPGSAGTRTTWTLSMWVKRGNLGSDMPLAGTGAGANQDKLTFSGVDNISWYTYQGSSYVANQITSQFFRDCSAWYHLVFVWDSTNGTAGDRQRIYVNGSEITSFITDTQPSSSAATLWNNNQQLDIGQMGSAYFDGYMAEVVFIDGLALTPTSFGEFNSDSPTIWQPKDVSGLTFGTNGFYLDFEDSANLGNDKNGGTDLTEVNLDATNQSSDSPTNNFATINPLSYSASSYTIAEGNLEINGNSSNAWRSIYTTIPLTSGKWYWEVKVDAWHPSDLGNIIVGVVSLEQVIQTSSNGKFFGTAQGYGYHSKDGKALNNDTVTDNGADYGDSYTAGDIVGIFLDLDNHKLYFSKNGTVQASGDPTSGATGTNAAFSITTGHTYVPCAASYYSEEQYTFNFGNPIVALSSAQNDGNGYGNFEYAPPSGYYALCTKNLAEYG
jgi:hypothetical protein